MAFQTGHFDSGCRTRGSGKRADQVFPLLETLYLTSISGWSRCDQDGSIAGPFYGVPGASD